jgi:hypothetical protein
MSLLATENKTAAFESDDSNMIAATASAAAAAVSAAPAAPAANVPALIP